MTHDTLQEKWCNITPVERNFFFFFLNAPEIGLHKMIMPTSFPIMTHEDMDGKEAVNRATPLHIIVLLQLYMSFLLRLHSLTIFH